MLGNILVNAVMVDPVAAASCFARLGFMVCLAALTSYGL